MSGSVTDRDAQALADLAHSLVESNTRRAATVASRAVELARARRQPEAEVAALHALGFAFHELGDPRAIRTLRAAVRLAERNGLVQRAAMARRPLAIYLAYAGAIDAAVREIDAACAALDGLELARSQVSRLGVLHLTGGTLPLRETDRAVETLRRAGDVVWEARLLKNRGFVLAERGDADAAEPDLARARDLYASVGATTAAVGAEYELARIDLARGNLPTCLARLDAIDTSGIPPRHRSALELLRAKALLAARLTREAQDALDLAVAIWRQAAVEDPEGRLEVVALSLIAGDADRARALARAAQRSFAARRSGGYAARAAGLALAAAIAQGGVKPSVVRSGRRAAQALAAAGWREESLRVRLAVARAAIELGSVRVARHELAACASLRRRGPVADRIEAWHVAAKIALASGDPPGAQHALRNGLRLLDAYRGALGAYDLRVSSSEIGVALARLGLATVLDDGDAAAVLDWAERLRANSLRLPRVVPVDSELLRQRYAELRSISGELTRAERHGRSSGSHLARHAAVEASIRELARHASGSVAVAATRGVKRELVRALGDSALVEVIELDGLLTAVTLVDGRVARHELGPVRELEDLVGRLRFAMGQLTDGRAERARRRTADGAVDAYARAASERLLSPLAGVLGDRPLVISPTGPLHALPWPVLPALRGRPFVLAPSALTWFALSSSKRRGGRKVALIAGPRLRHASAELSAICDFYPGAGVLTSRRATVAEVLRALDGAAMAHVACHGRFRSDSPLFSSLELADGPLNVYELQRLARVPELMILSACDLGASATLPGDELLGIAAALLAMGTRTIVASVLPVPDALSKRFMVDLHRRLAAGGSPAAALAAVHAGSGGGRYRLGGFVCIGAG